MSEVNTTNMSKLQVKKISALSDIIKDNGVNISELSIPTSISILLANDSDQGDLLQDNYKIKLSDIFDSIKNWVSKNIPNITFNNKNSKYLVFNKLENKNNNGSNNIDYEVGVNISQMIENDNINSISGGLVDDILLKKSHQIINDKIDNTRYDIESNLVNTNVNTSIPNNFVEIEKTVENKNVNYNIKLDIIENVDDNKNGLITKSQVVDLLNKDKWNII